MTRVNHRTTGIWALHVLRSFNKTLAGIVIKPLCGASVFAEQEPKYFLAGIAPCCDSKVYNEESETTTDIYNWWRRWRWQDDDGRSPLLLQRRLGPPTTTIHSVGDEAWPSNNKNDSDDTGLDDTGYWYWTLMFYRRRMMLWDADLICVYGYTWLDWSAENTLYCHHAIYKRSALLRLSMSFLYTDYWFSTLIFFEDKLFCDFEMDYYSFDDADWLAQGTLMYSLLLCSCREPLLDEAMLKPTVMALPFSDSTGSWDDFNIPNLSSEFLDDRRWQRLLIFGFLLMMCMWEALIPPDKRSVDNGDSELQVMATLEVKFYYSDFYYEGWWQTLLLAGILLLWWW